MKNSRANMTKFSLEELHKQTSHTDWERVRHMDDADVTAAAMSDPDSLPLDDAFFAVAQRTPPEKLLKEKKPQITLRIDSDVLLWYKSLGKGYQSKMNAVLRAYAEMHADR